MPTLQEVRRIFEIGLTVLEIVDTEINNKRVIYSISSFPYHGEKRYTAHRYSIVERAILNGNGDFMTVEMEYQWRGESLCANGTLEQARRHLPQGEFST